VSAGKPPATPRGEECDLAGWLRLIEGRQPGAIRLGLDRVSEVARRLGLAPDFPVITVGGTNGKGSTCAMLEAVLDAAGFVVGCYTSPHLLAYNERVRIARRPLGDDALCKGFAEVEAARGDVELTYFEFGTLAAVREFVRRRVDVAILEVGLGGRLDAVNVFDPDCAIVTSVGIDHVEYLGPTRESIGFEKAGIFRSGRPAVVADSDAPTTLLAHARAIGATLLLAGSDFRAVSEAGQWRYEGPGGMRAGLPHPALRGAYQMGNAAAAICALDTLRDRLPVSSGALREGLLTLALPGRFQVLPGRPVTVIDVAHNPHAARCLAQALAAMEIAGRTHAVFGMLRDKDMAGVVRELKSQVDHWHLAPLSGPRGASVEELQAALDAATVLDEVSGYESVAAAIAAARAIAALDDRIIIFGSFLTVAEALSTRALPTAD
jgi:dihydrofolate synthase/folylpolyglutamate synthase